MLKAQKATITIYFVRDSTTTKNSQQVYDIKDGHNDNDVYDTSIQGKTRGILMNRLFERADVEVVFKPYTCGDGADTAYCLDPDNKPILNIISQRLTIFVTNTLTIENVIIQGTNLATDPSTYDMSNFVPNGFFQFQLLIDKEDFVVPTLKMKNVEVKDFKTHHFVQSFIAYDTLGGNVRIENCHFTDFSTPNGLIANSFTRYDRNHYDFTTKGRKCNYYKSSLSECFSLSVTDTIFEEYDNTMMSGDFLNEGMILFLDNFDGQIEITSSVFRYHLLL